MAFGHAWTVSNCVQTPTASGASLPLDSIGFIDLKHLAQKLKVVNYVQGAAPSALDAGRKGPILLGLGVSTGALARRDKSARGPARRVEAAAGKGGSQRTQPSARGIAALHQNP